MSQLIAARANGNSADTFPTQRLPTVDPVLDERRTAMTTSTLERPETRIASADHHHPGDHWTCENCRTETSAVRKRCSDCGTSRY